MAARPRIQRLAIGALFLLAAGCKDDGNGGGGEDDGGDGPDPQMFPPATLDPDDEDQLKSLAGMSAPQVFNLGSIGIMLATFESGELCSTVDGVEMCMPLGNGCPAMTETDDGFVIEGGGCTTDDGAVWTGRVVARGVASPEDGDIELPQTAATIDYEELTIESPSDCVEATEPSRITIDGRMAMTPSDSGFDFDLELEISGSGVGDDCTEIDGVAGAYDYAGSRREEGTQQIWNGSGVMGSSTVGSYEISTVDEVLDASVCSYEALSGSTSVTAADDVVVVTYDGATDCDETSTATWTFNGADRGEMEGVRCTAGRTRLGPSALALGVMLLGVLRRRRPHG